jgi:adenylate cyclase class 2
METEYEAKFLNVNKDEVRAHFVKSGVSLVRPEFLQRRWVIDLPPQMQAKGTWLRVRDEGDKITMSWKARTGDKIDDQKELTLIVDDFDKAVEFLGILGCPPESYQETQRELWIMDDVEITIDTWPFLENFIEIEGKSEESVKRAAEKLGFDWSKAWFDSVTAIYRRKFGPGVHIRKLPRLTFDMPNPFH